MSQRPSISGSFAKEPIETSVCYTSHYRYAWQSTECGETYVFGISSPLATVYRAIGDIYFQGVYELIIFCHLEDLLMFRNDWRWRARGQINSVEGRTHDTAQYSINYSMSSCTQTLNPFCWATLIGT